MLRLDTPAFDSRRSAFMGLRAAVATSQPLAGGVAMTTMQRGGNAVDAAVAAMTTMNVVEPMSTGIGGDAFALVYDPGTGTVAALNGSGTAGQAASAERLRGRGLREMPQSGELAGESVTVPGAVRAWEELLRRFGTLSLHDALQPAIGYARDGFPVPAVAANMYRVHGERLRARPSGAELLMPSGETPAHGEVLRLPELAAALETVACEGADGFYGGDLGARIAAFVRECGGHLEHEDLIAYEAEWEAPISASYRGVEVFQCGPNGQGVSTLSALRLLEAFDLGPGGLAPADRLHTIVEALSLALQDALEHVGDPRHVDVPVERLLSDAHIEKRRAEIDPAHARSLTLTRDGHRPADTAYVAVVDERGMACSLIASLYEGFGTGLVVPGTGIALQNRGLLFSLEEGHPNELGPGRRPYHTIMPAMGLDGDRLWGCFGAVGGFRQPQTQVQALSAIVDLGLDPQAALDAPRAGIDVESGALYVEPGIDAGVLAELEARGHRLQPLEGFRRGAVGSGQFIVRLGEALVCGSDPRKDGGALVW